VLLGQARADQKRQGSAVEWMGAIDVTALRPATGRAPFTDRPRCAASTQQLATSIDHLPKDARPADLPGERPTTLELIVNLRTVASLGFTMPLTLLDPCR
jgi:hypothetical protein